MMETLVASELADCPVGSIWFDTYFTAVKQYIQYSMNEISLEAAGHLGTFSTGFQML